MNNLFCDAKLLFFYHIESFAVYPHHTRFGYKGFGVCLIYDLMYLLGIVFADYDHQHFARCLAVPSDSIECRYASVDFVDDTSGYLIVFFRNICTDCLLPDKTKSTEYENTAIVT